MMANSGPCLTGIHALAAALSSSDIADMLKTAGQTAFSSSRVCMSVAEADITSQSLTPAGHA